MNLRQLEHLITLGDIGSFTRAAERLHVTQSALSRSIQALEAELGAPLFDRVGKRSELTPLGQAVAARARRIGLEAAEIQRSAELLRQGDAGSIRVGLGAGPGALLMTPLLAHAAGLYPRVRVSISRGSPELQLQRLRERDLDTLVTDIRGIAPAPDLVIEPINELRGGFVCRADHPLAGQKALGIDAVLRYPVATSSLSNDVASALVQTYGPRAHPDQMAALRCEDVSSLVQVMAQTDAVYLGVIAAAREGLEAGRLVELDMARPLGITARYGYVRLAGRTEAPVMGMLRGFVGERLRD
ncbi:MAG: LysR family transcriptional regulator [Proteobacteria bacterium]|nr:LysR family transcriptional regulator [Pseudomonadota bacterium]